MNADLYKWRSEGVGGVIFENVSKAVFYLSLFIVAAHFALRLYPMIVWGEPPHAIDFTLYWAAAKLAWQGAPLAVFDREAIVATAGLAQEPEATFLWLYPAFALMLLAPIGALSYPQAAIAFATLSLVGLWASLRRPASALPHLWRWVLAAPVVVIGSVMIGQISALWTAALVTALWTLARGRHVMAGFMLALLTVKPQFGLLIPVALVAAGHWRAVGWAAAFTLLLNSAATVFTGTAYWPAFLGAMRQLADLVIVGQEFKLHLLATFYGLMRALGTSHDHAIVVQIAVTIGAAVALAWTWSRKKLPDDLKAAIFCAAIPLATPYALYTVTTTTLAAGVFLVRAGFARSLAGKLWLLVIWLGPLPALLRTDLLSPALYLPPLIGITFLTCLALAMREATTPSSKPQTKTASPSGLADDSSSKNPDQFLA